MLKPKLPQRRAALCPDPHFLAWKALAGFALLSFLSELALAGETRWRLDEALGSPAWLEIGGSYRMRFEHLDNTFRAAGERGDELLLSRLLVRLDASGDKYFAGFELQDSRAWLSDALTPLGNDDVNAVEPLQAYIGFRTSGGADSGSGFDVRLGRMTMNIGSRRLVARNNFRNTINAFTGLRARWSTTGGILVDSFYTLPLIRLPGNQERDRLADNDIELDEASDELRFWGLHLSGFRPLADTAAEVYLLGLEEQDRPQFPTRNRDLLTAGLRMSGSKRLWSWELEAAYQTGESRATSLPTDLQDLDHSAWFAHMHIARKLDARWEPELRLRFDYASGDGDPDDGDIGRFDGLFGTRGVDYGMTGMYGVFSRSNLISPGAELRLRFTSTLEGVLAYRAGWLAEERDALSSASLRDRNGESGSFIGQEMQIRVTWNAISDNLAIEAGGAVLFKGEFLETVPGAPPPGDTLYGYVQATFTY